LRIFSTAAGVATLVIAGHGVAAAQVSANGARDVQTTLESYFGKGSDGTSAVRVTTNGTNDGYDVSIDLARLAKPLEMAGVTVKPALFGFGLKPAAGGTWAYTQTSFPTLSMTVPNGSFEFSTNAFAGTGSFDPKLGSFTTYAATAKSLSSRTTDANSKVAADTQDVRLNGTAKDAGGGLIDATFSYATGNFAETITGAAGGQPIRISVADASASGDVAGQAAKATLDLWSFLVGHASKDALANDQAALKTKLLAALPLFKRVAVNAGANNLIVETPFGNARVSKIGLTEAATGVVPEGQFEFGLSLGTIEPPSGVAPAWAISLIPKESNLGVKLTGFNPDRFTRLVIDKLDLKAPKPLDLKDEEALAAILPSGKLRVDLTPGKLVNDLYNVAWSGQIEVDPTMSFVSGKATVTAKGLDKIRETLAKQTDTVQYATGLALVKGMAKQVDGNDVWELEFDSNGTFVVNGQKMGG
jgi:hypothetical protein